MLRVRARTWKRGLAMTILLVCVIVLPGQATAGPPSWSRSRSATSRWTRTLGSRPSPSSRRPRCSLLSTSPPRTGAGNGGRGLHASTSSGAVDGDPGRRRRAKPVHSGNRRTTQLGGGRPRRSRSLPRGEAGATIGERNRDWNDHRQRQSADDLGQLDYPSGDRGQLPALLRRSSTVYAPTFTQQADHCSDTPRGRGRRLLPLPPGDYIPDRTHFRSRPVNLAPSSRSP